MSDEPSGRAERTPTVAPFNSCIACYRGDTTTAVYVDGEAEWHIAAVVNFAGLSVEEATATLEAWAEVERGCDPGKVPAGRFQGAFRLCGECAEKTGAKIADLGADKAPFYTQP